MKITRNKLRQLIREQLESQMVGPEGQDLRNIAKEEEEARQMREGEAVLTATHNVKKAGPHRAGFDKIVNREFKHHREPISKIRDKIFEEFKKLQPGTNRKRFDDLMEYFEENGKIKLDVELFYSDSKDEVLDYDGYPYPGEYDEDTAFIDGISKVSTVKNHYHFTIEIKR